MSDEKFCAACEGKLEPSSPSGDICLKCFQILKKPKARPREVVVIFPVVCPHETCRKHDPDREPKEFGVLLLNRRHQWVYAGGPFTRRIARREAKRLRADAAREAQTQRRKR